MTEILDRASVDNGAGNVTVKRTGLRNRVVRVEWPRTGQWITFDSMWEYDYWLYVRHAAADLGVAYIVRNTTKLVFPEEVTYLVPRKGKPPVERVLNAYRPDFIVIYLDGRCEWIEIKGFEDAKHLAIREALRVHFPHLPITLIDRARMLAIQKEWRPQIEGWVTIK